MDVDKKAKECGSRRYFFKVQQWLSVLFRWLRNLPCCRRISSWTTWSYYTSKFSGEGEQFIVIGPASSHKRTQVLVCGPAGSGKTTWIYRLKLGTYIKACPTASVVAEEVQLPRTAAQLGWATDPTRADDAHRRVLFYDTGHTFCSESDQIDQICAVDHMVVIFDASQPSTVDNYRETLFALLSNPDTVPTGQILVIAGKQDLGGAITKELESLLCIPEELKYRCFVYPASNLSGDGLVETVEWLASSSRSFRRPQHGKAIQDRISSIFIGGSFPLDTAPHGEETALITSSLHPNSP